MVFLDRNLSIEAMESVNRFIVVHIINFAIHVSSVITVVTNPIWETISENSYLMEKIVRDLKHCIVATNHKTTAISRGEELQKLYNYKSQRVSDKDMIIYNNQSQSSSGNDGEVGTKSGQTNTLRDCQISVNKPTHKDKNQSTECNHKDVKCLKQNRTSTVNKPNHQDVIDNKQPTPDVICENRPDQKAKGVNIKTRKQPDQDVKWLNIMPGNLMSYLKPLTLLLLVTCLSVTSATPRDFKWLPPNEKVKGLYETNITLVWKYESNLMVDKIDISRSKTEYEKKNVALWTPEKGSVANRLISTNVTLQYWKEGDVGSINLTLIKAYPVDFDKTYSCVISSEHGLHSMDKELEAYKIEYRPVNKVVEGRPGQDVKLVWIYKYPLPIKYVNFYLDHDIKDDILSWSRFYGIYDVEDRYKNRVMLNMTSNNDQVKITLTLLNTTRDDYNHTYNSRAISPKGYWTVKEMYLQLSPEEEPEKKKESKQQPSSTSGLSKVSIFLVCFVWLLAVQI